MATKTYNNSMTFSSLLANPTPVKNYYKKQKNTASNSPKLLGVDAMNKLYGLDIDQDKIKTILDTATNAAYNTQFNQQDIAEDNFYNELASTAATQYDLARQDRGAAIMSGASAGARAANELSAMLGVTQNSAEALTALSQQRKAIADQQTAALLQNASTAMTTANTNRGTLASNAASKYTADSARLAQMLTNNANAAIQRHTDDSNLKATTLTSGATTEAARIAAAGEIAAAGKTAAAQLRAAQIAAQTSKGGTSNGSGTSTGTKKTTKKNNNKNLTIVATNLIEHKYRNGVPVERVKYEYRNANTNKIVKKEWGGWVKSDPNTWY